MSQIYLSVVSYPRAVAIHGVAEGLLNLAVPFSMSI